MSEKTTRFSEWAKVLVRAACFWFALVMADFLVVYFYGSWFWSNAGYFFGTDIKTTSMILMFIEGAVLFTAGAIWASGSMETTFEGDNLMTNPYYQKEQWKQRQEQTRGQNLAGKILMFVGGPLLIAALILCFI